MRNLFREQNVDTKFTPFFPLELDSTFLQYFLSQGQTYFSDPFWIRQFSIWAPLFGLLTAMGSIHHDASNISVRNSAVENVLRLRSKKKCFTQLATDHEVHFNSIRYVFKD